MVERLPVLVVGGGIAGMAAGISLAQRGFPVDLVEIDPEWRVYGAGITITGPTYRAFAGLGLLQQLQDAGYGAAGGTRLCTAAGDVLDDLPTQPLGPDMPPIGGIMRPQLHEILSKRTRESGVRVRLGITHEGWREEGAQVQVRFTDGSQSRYSLVIVADGASSRTRRALFPETPEPRYTGQYCWRLAASRPSEIDRAYIFLGGHVFAGLVPTSASGMYLWLLETRAERGRGDDAEQHRELARIMAPFGGVLAELREALEPKSNIICRPLSALLMPRPWYRGRIILIGDAAHPTTPHLASGAGIAVEDALVLGALLAESGDVDAAFAGFMDLRWERCRDVVETSVAIGALQQRGASAAEFGRVVGGAEQRLRADIWSGNPPPAA
jgi:2-polyprenyl-6-methoxyphenol hydroxylase-like FAD-dependent oxidoreductase